MHALIEAAGQSFSSLEAIHRICFVNENPDRTQEISEAMDVVLRRARVAVAKRSVDKAIRAEIEDRLDHLAKLDPAALRVIQDVRGALRDGRLTFLGTAGRKFREYVISSILGNQFKGSRELEFNALRNKNVAEWICGYLNLLRVFGNHSAHESLPETQRPPEIDSRDVTLLLFAIQRMLDFRISWISSATSD